ncbi:MAG: hypothetical protein ACOX2L_07800 [Anaerolineae bacterium]|jgi:hypothetical protein
MRVILSRKGFDSSYGGYPSLILPNRTLISLPIPGGYDEIRFASVRSGYGDMTLYDVMRRIRDTIYYKTKVTLTEETRCHLDPDLRHESIPRSPDWKGCFGQAGAAQTVLENNGVKKDDIILFFGWFNHYYADKGLFRQAEGHGKHIIFGYMQIETKIYTNKDVIPEWLLYHPHALERRVSRDTNCIFTAQERLSWDHNLPGYGIFRYSEKLDLTKDGLSRSKWELPEFFRNKKITYHSNTSWKDGYFQSAHRGQEFVIEEDDDILNWAKWLINESIC